MTYKNGIKEYTLTTILFGTAMGLIFGLYLKSLFGGIITGIVNGVLFTFVIFLFVKHQEKRLGIQAKQMPSTSPANAAWKLDMLVKTWGEALLPILNKEGDER